MLKKKLQGILICFLLLPVSLAYASYEEEVAKNNPRFGFYGQGDCLNFWGDTKDTVYNDENFRNCLNIPRARFSVGGKEYDLVYYTSFDVAEQDFRDLYFRYEKYSSFWLTLGQFKSPFNLWFITSQRHFNFLEQSLPTLAFYPGFRGGIMAQLFFEHVALSAALLTPEINNTIRFDQVYGHVPLAGNGRMTIVPLKTETEVIHFGVAGIIQDTDSTGRLRFRAFPEAQDIQNHFLVDTDYFYDCKNYVGMESEFFIMFSSLSLSGEYYNTHVNRNLNDLYFDGGSLIVDYFLTGEHYEYHFKNGCVDGISKFKHDYGAWQLLFRYSTINLDSGDVHGGKENDLTFGLNWWANDYLKFLADFIIADAHPAENGVNRHMNILAIRCQLSF